MGFSLLAFCFIQSESLSKGRETAGRGVINGGGLLYDNSVLGKGVFLICLLPLSTWSFQSKGIKNVCKRHFSVFGFYSKVCRPIIDLENLQ